MMNQWNWFYYQWSSVTVMTFIFIIHNTSANSVPQNSSNYHTSYTETYLSASYEDPLAKLDLRLGRWDSLRFFKTFDYAAVGELYSDISTTRHVCLATQSSIDSLQEILNMAAHWSGPISLAVFVVGEEMKLLQSFVMWLLRCQPETYSRLAIHLTTPSYRVAVLGTGNWAQNCSERPSFSKERTIATEPWRGKNPYPQNVLRNLARKNCHTPYVYLLDIDIVPSKDMAEALDQFLSIQGCIKCVYVIPTYELHNKAKFPSNKSQLLQLVKKKWAVPFHKNIHPISQSATNFNMWEARFEYELNCTHISHSVTNFKIEYEPFYVAPDSVPSHDERFVGYGYTRNTQVFETFLLGYKFKVLSPIFTIHWGLQSTKTRPGWRFGENSKNCKKALILMRELAVRYGMEGYERYINGQA